jgi:hypothetical protein
MKKMIKKVLLSMAVLGMILMVQSTFSQEMTSSKGATKVDVDTFKENAPDMVGKTVVITGMVTHVCKHGGKKMFIMNSDADVQVKITTGEDIASFPVELEGESVWVNGVVEEIIEEVVEEEHAEHEQDEAHQNIYHKPQYSIACAEYQVVKK